MDDRSLLGVGLIGVIALCCVMPALAVLLGVVGLSALTGYILILLSAFIIFIGLTAYALWKWNQAG